MADIKWLSSRIRNAPERRSEIAPAKTMLGQLIMSRQGGVHIEPIL